MRHIIIAISILLSTTSYAGIISSDTPPVISVPNGLISTSPIISDATFAKIAKKNNLSNKKFDEEDLHKLDVKFTEVTSRLKKEQVFEKISKIF